MDIAYWQDQETGEEWVYVTGYHTLANGATVFATSKYPATYTLPGENDPLIVHYPLLNTNPTGTHRAVAIEVDYEGNVYVTGESTDPTGADGQDFVIIKYDKNLEADGDWILAGHQDAVVRWDNPFVAGPLSDDRPVGLSLAADYTPGQEEPNAIGITGTTYVGALVGRDDIVTVLFDVNTGNVYSGFGNGGAVYKSGTANNDDSPVGIESYWRVSYTQSSPYVLRTVVAGTIRQVNGGQGNEDIWTTEYDVGGNVLWEDIYNGPMNADDVATALTIDVPVMMGAFVCGYTLHYETTASAGSGGGGGSGAGARSGGGGAALTFADWDYIALGFELKDYPVSTTHWGYWYDLGLPNVEGVRVFNGPGPSSVSSDDKAAGIVTDAFSSIWLTGTVREPDGFGYDTTTIRYAPVNLNAVPDQIVHVDLPSTSEAAVAIVANHAYTDEAVYVTGTIDAGYYPIPMIQTFKIIPGSATAPAWTKLFGNVISDIPAAIIAPTRGLRASIYVFGRSVYTGTHYDQVGVHYTQP